MRSYGSGKPQERPKSVGKRHKAILAVLICLAVIIAGNGREMAAEGRTGNAAPVFYSVDGAALSGELQAYLWSALKARGIESIYMYAQLIAYQESRFDSSAVSASGRDKGLFQYREAFWEEVSAENGRPGADIFDPYAQIDVFAAQMSRRIHVDHCGIAELISRHNQSDWGSYNQEYVSQVMQWEGTVRVIDHG